MRHAPLPLTKLVTEEPLQQFKQLEKLLLRITFTRSCTETDALLTQQENSRSCPRLWNAMKSPGTTGVLFASASSLPSRTALPSWRRSQQNSMAKLGDD